MRTKKRKTIIAKSDKSTINAKSDCINEILFPDNVRLHKLSSATGMVGLISPDKIFSCDTQTELENTDFDDKYLINVIAPLGEQKINDDKNFHYLVSATRKGLPYKSLSRALTFMPFDKKEWTQILHISSRTLDRLKKDKKKLNSLQTEKLIDVTLLFEYGMDVFGSKDKFSKWLSRESIALGGIEPKTLLDTNQGIKAIETELSRIEYGVLA